MDGTAIDTDWCKGLDTGSAELIGYSETNVTDAMKKTVEETSQKIIDGSLKVFDTSTFTVSPKTLEANSISSENYTIDEDGHLLTYMADAVYDDQYTPDTQVIKDGEFSESSVRSAPYFNVIIDGVTIK